jgi:hypothetical protein
LITRLAGAAIAASMIVAIERFEALEQLRAMATGLRYISIKRNHRRGTKVRALFEDRAKTGDERLGSTLGAARERA